MQPLLDNSHAARERSVRRRRLVDRALQEADPAQRLVHQRRCPEHRSLELRDFPLLRDRRHHATGHAVDVDDLKALRGAERREHAVDSLRERHLIRARRRERRERRRGERKVGIRLVRRPVHRIRRLKPEIPRDAIDPRARWRGEATHDLPARVAHRHDDRGIFGRSSALSESHGG